MTRQSISFTDPNSEWLRTKVEVEGEYRSNSELVNELVRRERARERAELAAIRQALQEGERSGVSTKSADDIMAEVLARRSNE